MQDQGEEIEILSKKSVFGKQIAEIKILSSGEIKSVPFADLTDNNHQPTTADIEFKAKKVTTIARSAATATLTVPAKYSKAVAQCWIIFQTADGQLQANSNYIGTVTVF